ncbi:MAG: SDR family oxidoreductase [Chloroflexi bacterium]|nr:SDR family oxidoreductase [Chloroflexota bacterium]
MIERRLEGKVALIAGAGNGMGRATAYLFAAEGAKVVVCARRETLIEQTARRINEHGAAALAIQADVTEEAQARRVVEQTVATYGRLDILMNNAGMSGLNEATLVETRAEDWDSLINTNLRSIFCCSKYALPEMVKSGGGSIINVAAAFETRQWVNAAYAASKGGAESLTQKMAREWFRHNIRVNCISPGSIRRSPVVWPVQPIKEPLTRSGDPADILHFGGRPEDIAYAALFLASDESSWITGLILPLDGGAAVR